MFSMVRENLKMAIESIKSNRMRSFLTMLGIIIGIASVIMIVAAGDGAKKEMMSQFEGIGTNSVILNLDSKKAVDSDYITYEDMAAIKEKIPHVTGVSPVWQYFGEAVFRGNTMDVMIASGSNDLLQFDTAEFVTGRSFTEDEFLSAKDVCMIDEHMANKFFGNTDVVGMTLDVNVGKEGRMKLKIIGVVTSSFGEFYREGMPGFIYMPITTLTQAINEKQEYNSVYIMADDKQYTEAVGNSAVNLVAARHSSQSRNVYYAQNMMQQVEMVNTMIGLVQTFVAAVAAISLVVGGIGVMNIMLVAVTERTREIGIRKSLGAKTNSILFQFLMESAILTIIGGIIGLILGYVGGFTICAIAGIDPVFSTATVGGTLFFSAAVGIFFGIYPARKAAKLNPIDALRHE